MNYRGFVKKLLLGFFTIVGIVSFCFENQSFFIINYDESYKNSVMELVFEDPLQLFVGSMGVTRGLISHDFFVSENKKSMEHLLNDPLRVKKVLTDGKQVIGFLSFCKMREPSLEDCQKLFEQHGQPSDEKSILAVMPHAKKESERKTFIELECIAVSRMHRKKGYGKELIRDTIETIKKLYPDIKSIRLNVNADNEPAKHLYQSMGFVQSDVQPLVRMGGIQYEKELSQNT